MCVQVVRKWCVLLLSELLADTLNRSRALPWGAELAPLALGTDETCSTLEAMAALLTIALNRWGRPSRGGGCCSAASRLLLGCCRELCGVVSSHALRSLA